MRYAQLGELKLSRDWLEPESLGVTYVPRSSGTVTLRHASEDRPAAEMSIHVRPEDVGSERKVRWQIEGLKTGEAIEVVSRDGWSLATARPAVPEAIVPAGGNVAVEDAGSEAAPGLYSRRTRAGRAEWIGKLGGTPISEQAVGDGLDWLARHQAADGSRSSRCLGRGAESRCEKTAPCTDGGGTFEMAHTGLAVLAFQAGGHYYFNDTKYSAAVGKALDWIVDHQKDDGALVGSLPVAKRGAYHKNFMYEHGIAAFALGDACAAAIALHESPQPRYLQGLHKAVEFIEENQHLDGGWRYGGGRYEGKLKDPSDSSVTGWQVLALKSAREAGIPPSAGCLAKVRKFFQARQTGQNGRTGYADNRTLETEATTGVGMLARQFLFDQPDAPLVKDAARYLADFAQREFPPDGPPKIRDYYLWYNCTLAMFLAGGQPWKTWNDCVRDTVIKLQKHQGCERGSWDPSDRWGSSGGRIYSTALAILTLEVYYRYALERPDR